jgi:hypothetical protein
MSDRSMTEAITLSVKEFRAAVPDCVAAGIVDMATGMLLAVDTLDNYPTEILDLLAAATFDIFQGRNVLMIEDVFKQRRGVGGNEHYFQEILVNSQNMVHLFLRGTLNVDLVAAVICRRTVNIGMLFAQSRMVMRRLDEGVG